jgi:hypothetical protein
MNRQITTAEIEAARTPNGGWTKAQLAKWGVPWPPPKGWKAKLTRWEKKERKLRKPSKPLWHADEPTEKQLMLLAKLPGDGKQPWKVPW